MGLAIRVNGKTYYDYPYPVIHILRHFAFKKEFPEIDATDRTMYGHMKEIKRFKNLILHSDTDGGYVPDGVRKPDLGQWWSANDLLAELTDLGAYRSEMGESVEVLYDSILAATKASIKLKKPMRFQ